MKFIAYTIMMMVSLFFISSDKGSIEDVFPEIEGLQKGDSLETYLPDNLYDYINGAADSYLKYDFSELNLMRYEGEDEITLKIEVYEHSSGINAFGIYSNEKPLDGYWLEIGGQAYQEEDILNFYKGKYYVKIMSNDIENEQVLVDAASFVADKLEGTTEAPAASRMFPEKGKIPYSERYVNKNFLGYKNLSEAFTAEYESGGHYFKMFIIVKENFMACRNMIESYAATISHDTEIIKEGRFSIKDPYQGNLQLFMQDNLILGIMDLDDTALSDEYMKLLIDSAIDY